MADGLILEVFESSPTPGQIINDLDINITTLYMIQNRNKE